MRLAFKRTRAFPPVMSVCYGRANSNKTRRENGMADGGGLARNEAGIATAVGILKQRFGE